MKHNDRTDQEHESLIRYFPELALHVEEQNPLSQSPWFQGHFGAVVDFGLKELADSTVQCDRRVISTELAEQILEAAANDGLAQVYKMRKAKQEGTAQQTAARDKLFAELYEQIVRTAPEGLRVTQNWIRRQFTEEKCKKLGVRYRKFVDDKNLGMAKSTYSQFRKRYRLSLAKG